MATVTSIQPRKRLLATTPKSESVAPLQFFTRKVKSNHKVKATFDCGNEPGPWVIVSFNQTAFCAGYLPKKERSKK